MLVGADGLAVDVVEAVFACGDASDIAGLVADGALVVLEGHAQAALGDLGHRDERQREIRDMQSLPNRQRPHAIWRLGGKAGGANAHCLDDGLVPEVDVARRVKDTVCAVVEEALVRGHGL